MRCLGKSGDTQIFLRDRKGDSLEFLPYLVTIDYEPNVSVSYFIMARDETDASFKVKTNIQHVIEYFAKENNSKVVEKLKIIIGAMEYHTKVTHIDFHRAIKVIGFDVSTY